MGGSAALFAAALTAAALAAGLTAVQPLAQAPVGTVRRVTAALAVTGLLSAVLNAVTHGPGGWLPVLPGAAALILPPVLALPPVLGRRAAAAAGGAVAVGAALCAAAAAQQPGRPAGPAPDVGVVLLVLSGSLWLGSAGQLWCAAAGQRHSMAGRLAPVLGAAAIGFCAAGPLWATTAGGLAGLTPRPAVAVLLATVAGTGLAVLTLGWLVLRDSWSRMATAAHAMAVAAAVAAALTTVAVPAPSGVPVLTGVAGPAGTRVPVLVVPGRPGRNLVQIGGRQGAVGTDRGRMLPATARPGSGSLWSTVWLPAGEARLWVQAGGPAVQLLIRTGPATPGRGGPDLTGPDGPECAGTALGTALAGAAGPLRSCPAERLSPPDAAALRATVEFLRSRGNTEIALVGDPSPRGRQAGDTVRAAAAAAGLRVLPTAGIGRPLLIVAGWAGADAAIAGVGAGRLRSEGTYLAPWLLNTRLLSAPAGQLLPLRFNPTDPPAAGYVTALRRLMPGEPATAAGYAGWLGTAGGPGGPVRLYAAAQVSVPGDPHAALAWPATAPTATAPTATASTATDHHGQSLAAAAGHSSARWLPGGTITAVTLPLSPG